MHNKYIYHRYVQCTLCTIDSRHMHILSLISKSFMHHTSIPHRYTHQRYKNHKYVYYKYICHRYVHHNSIHVSRWMHHRFMHSRYIHCQTHVWFSFCTTLPATCKMFFFCIFSFFIFFWSIFFSFVVISFLLLSYLFGTGYTHEQLCPAQPSRVGRLSFEIPRC